MPQSDERILLTDEYIRQDLMQDFRRMRNRLIQNAVSIPCAVVVWLFLHSRQMLLGPAKTAFSAALCLFGACILLQMICALYEMISFRRCLRQGMFRLTEDTLLRIAQDEPDIGISYRTDLGPFYRGNHFLHITRDHYYFARNGRFSASEKLRGCHTAGETFYLLRFGKKDRIVRIYSTQSYKR